MFGWFRRFRRRRLLGAPVPAEWLEILTRRVPFFRGFEDELRARFVDDVRVFVAEKHWIPAADMEITDEVKVVIAAAAARLTLHLGIDVYNRLTEIVVYPSHYVHGDSDSETVVFGEAHAWGPVVLSWDAVVAGLANEDDGHDTATHEFAHVLDRAGGSFNGTPNLRAHAHYRAWARVMTDRFDQLRDGHRGIRRALRDYGATNEAEFFAVATEAFFEKPDQVRRRAPDLYEELSRFYGFDPAAARHDK